MIPRKLARFLHSPLGRHLMHRLHWYGGQPRHHHYHGHYRYHGHYGYHGHYRRRGRRYRRYYDY